MAIVPSESSPANGSAAVFEILNVLCDSGHHVLAWATGTGGTYSGVVDLTANPYGGSGSGAGNLGNNLAWFRARAADGSYEVLFQRQTADQTWTIQGSVLGFTGGTPDEDTPPTATDAVTLFSAAQAFPTSAWRLFVSADDAAPYGFTAYGITLGGGNVLHFIVVEPLRETSIDPADTAPILWWRYYNATGLAASYCAIASMTETNLTKRFASAGSNVTVSMLLYATWSQIQAFSDMRAAPPETVGSQGGIAPLALTEPPLDIKVVKTGATSSTTGWVGTCQRLRWTTVAGRVNGGMLTGTTHNWINMAGAWVPWGPTEPTLG